MSAVYIAANFIPNTSGFLWPNFVEDSGHLQFAYETDQGQWTEIEVQMPNSLALGDWDFHADGTRPHGGRDNENNEFTTGVASNGSFTNPYQYVRVELTPNEGQTTDQLWQLISNVAQALQSVGEDINYDTFQNSNSFATTVLETIGYSYHALLAELFPLGLGNQTDIQGFPGGGLNVFQDGANVWQLSDYSPIAVLLDDATLNLTVEGTDGSDQLIGGRGSDIIGGGAGDDTISVGLNNDVVRPGTGNNSIFLDGGFSNQVIFLGNEADYTVAHPTVGSFTYTNNITGDATTIYHSNELNNQRIIFGGATDMCFPAGTLVKLWGGPEKPIERITSKDIVLTHDPRGNPVPGVVDKLFTNTTQEFVRLTFADGREDLVSTPGHRFLTETGDYMEIGHMLRLGGGTVRLTDTDGSIVTAAGEVITHSAKTAHLFEQSATKTIAFHGNTVLKEEAAQGWQTYNFEVREHHNYVAGGIRVHNDSVLSHLQAGDNLQALSSDLRDAIVLRDVDGDGTQEIVFIDGFEGTGGDTILQGEYVIYSAIDIPFGVPLDLETWLLEELTADPTLATTPEAIALLLNLLPTVETYSESFGAPSADGIVTGTTGNDLIDVAYADIDGDQITADADTLLGLDGNDTLIGGAGADSLDGGAGVDTASYAGAGAGVIADLRGVQAQTGDALGDVFTGIENLTGSGFDDALYGDNSGNLLIGGAGDDTLRPTGGDDTVIGGDGDDVIYAHTGQDVIEGNAGNDTLQGGEGDDTLTGGAG
ncbi:MAG: hypothetical protein ACRBCU_16650, partial [Planktotalea sp.]